MFRCLDSLQWVAFTSDATPHPKNRKQTKAEISDTLRKIKNSSVCFFFLGEPTVLLTDQMQVYVCTHRALGGPRGCPLNVANEQYY